MLEMSKLILHIIPGRFIILEGNHLKFINAYEYIKWGDEIGQCI